MSRGIIYFNTGRKCLPRLIVSLYTLRKCYSGPVALLYTGVREPEYDNISKQFGLSVKENQVVAAEGSNKVYLEKCLTHLNSPFDTTIWLDADTVVLQDPSNDLWDFAERNEFAICQFSNWQTFRGQIAKRLRAWANIYPQLFQNAISFGPAINCGVIAFIKSSKLMQDWYKHAVLGRETFIPDEVCCQLLLHKYPHIILSEIYNTSCKYSKVTPETKVIHFHGRKHCRLNTDGKLMYNADIWLKYYIECLDQNICGIREIDNIPDRQLRRYKCQIAEHNK